MMIEAVRDALSKLNDEERENVGEKKSAVKTADFFE